MVMMVFLTPTPTLRRGMDWEVETMEVNLVMTVVALFRNPQRSVLELMLGKGEDGREVNRHKVWKEGLATSSTL